MQPNSSLVKSVPEGEYRLKSASAVDDEAVEDLLTAGINIRVFLHSAILRRRASLWNWIFIPTSFSF
jgi:hypothetical protein